MTALQPDVVIGSTDHHEKLAAQLEDSGIPVILLRTKTYDDVKHNLDIMGQVYGKEDQGPRPSMTNSIRKSRYHRYRAEGWPAHCHHPCHA